uniref:Uncharacterized protein n=1 Tax=Anguilla anguilla TaxID=7936 RepID=A0A0E9VH92_ANGAN
MFPFPDRFSRCLSLIPNCCLLAIWQNARHSRAHDKARTTDAMSFNLRSARPTHKMQLNHCFNVEYLQTV